MYDTVIHICEGGTLINLPETLSGYDAAIENLRNALAEIVAQRGEYVLKKEAKYRELYECWRRRHVELQAGPAK
jgi:hypothetical protein